MKLVPAKISRVAGPRCGLFMGDGISTTFEVV